MEAKKEDRAESHDLKLRFLIFILLFFFPFFLGGKRKGEKIANRERETSKDDKERKSDN